MGSSEPRPLRIYLGAVALSGGVSLAISAAGAARTPHPAAWLALAALGVLTGGFKANVAMTAAQIAIDDTFFMAIAVLFGPGPATIAVASSAFVLPVRRRRPLRQIIFNTSALAGSMWTAASTFFALAGVEPLALSSTPAASIILPMIALCAVYFAFNSGLMAIVIGLDTGQSPVDVWRRHFQWLSISYF